MAKKVDNIIIHCTDSPFGCVREIRQWHLEKGWRDIGYHFVILNGEPVHDYYIPTLDGAIECGRYLNSDMEISDREIGAHTLGYNDHSIGVCLVGVRKFTPHQIFSLKKLLIDFIVIYGVSIDSILGHCETESGKSSGKTCPNFDVGSIRNDLRRTFDGI